MSQTLTFVPGGATSVPYEFKETRFLPKIALRYEPDSDISAYAQWSRGHKSGGVNLPAWTGTFFGLYDPERLDAFEIGLKSQWFDRRLTANFAAFYYDYKNLQVDRNVGVIGVVVDNADARIYGIEGDIRWAATDDLSFTLALSFQNGRFTEFSSFDPAQNVVRDFSGEPLTRAPDFTMNAGIQYGVDIGDGLLSRLEMQANAVHTSTIILTYFNNTEFERQGPLTLLNLSATVSSADSKTRLSAFVNNLTNEVYKQAGAGLSAAPGVLFYVGNYGPPRTWGLRLSRSF